VAKTKFPCGLSKDMIDSLSAREKPLTIDFQIKKAWRGFAPPGSHFFLLLLEVVS
jgi:hypothetical protein